MALIDFFKPPSKEQPVPRRQEKTRPALDGRIDVRELLKNLSAEELKFSAEAYFASIKDPTYHLAKPFSSLEECPSLLMHFSRVLQAGAFVPGQKVLEFGAGSCWAGRFLNQLGLEVISLDISPSALRIGERLKTEWKVFGNQPGHSFLEFDGARIDLPDASIDRVVCLDCFHHVANPEHVLREFYRILKPNGLIAFSEPGPLHSLTPQSQEEMKNYRVIENDIVVGDIWAMAKSIGYANIFFSLASVQPMVMDFARYQHFQQNGMDVETVGEMKKTVEEHHENVTIFFLVKGKLEEGDSRNRAGLVADISITSQQQIKNEDGQKSLQLSFYIKNISGKTWLRSGSGLGHVNLGVHLFNEQGQMVNYDFHRHLFLADDFQPDASIDFACTVPWPEGLESFMMEFDLVSEQICWFALNGSKTEKLVQKT